MKEGKFNIVIGGQAGSEAKGKLSAVLAEKQPLGALFMAASPNAGHTVILDRDDEYCKKYVTYHIPAAAITCNAPILLGPTSLINPEIFAREIEENMIDPARIYIDKRAIVLDNELIDREVLRGMSDIGSTLQGIGEARIAKILRSTTPPTPAYLDPILLSIPRLSLRADVSIMLNSMLAQGATVLAEMTQGADLCLEHGIHPRYCTSKMIHPAMCMAEAGVSPKYVGDVYGVIRTFPIRVNNRTGSSGPYPGAEEITWADVAAECGHPSPEDFGEITTTTHLPRRVFTFSWDRFAHFISVCSPDFLCLQFANYLDWKDNGRTEWFCLSNKVRNFVAELEKFSGVPVSHIGTGPFHSHMVYLPPAEYHYR